jgi:hypothetical protein
LGADVLLCEINHTFKEVINELTIFIGGDIDGICPILQCHVVLASGLFLAALSCVPPGVVIRFRALGELPGALYQQVSTEQRRIDDGDTHGVRRDVRAIIEQI